MALIRWISSNRRRIALDLRLKRKQLESEVALKKQREAATQKDITQTEESKAKTRGTNVETLCKLVPAIALGYGLIVAFIYFFVVANFFPSGVTVGDALLFIFIAVGYALVSMLFVGFGFLVAALPPLIYTSALSASPRPRTTASKDELFLFWTSAAIPFIAGCIQIWLFKFEFNLVVSIVICLTVALIIFPGAKRRGYGNWEFPLIDWAELAFYILVQAAIWIGFSWWIWELKDSAIAFFGAALLAAFSAWLGLTSLNSSAGATSSSKSFIPIILLAIALGVPLMFDLTQSKGGLASYVFEGLGLRTTKATVRISGGSLDSIKDSARNAGVELAMCFDDAENATVSPVDVLWHGMGSRSLLALPSNTKDEKDSNNDALEVKADELRIMRSGHIRCHDLKTKMFFESNETSYAQADQLKFLSQEATIFSNSIKKTECIFKNTKGHSIQCNWKLSRVIIRGYADPMPRSDGGNEKLACDRASRVLKDLEASENGFGGILKNDQPKVDIESLGSRASNQKTCADQKDKTAQRECHSANRRVQIRLLFSASGKNIPQPQLPKEDSLNGCLSQLSQ